MKLKSSIPQLLQSLVRQSMESLLAKSLMALLLVTQAMVLLSKMSKLTLPTVILSAASSPELLSMVLSAEISSVVSLSDQPSPLLVQKLPHPVWQQLPMLSQLLSQFHSPSLPFSSKPSHWPIFWTNQNPLNSACCQSNSPNIFNKS